MAGDISDNLPGYWGTAATLVSAPASRLGHQPVRLAFIDRQLAGFLAFTMGGGLIAGIRVAADPGKLASIRTQRPSRR